MIMNKPVIKYAIDNRCCYLKLQGDIRYSSGIGFDKFSKEIFKNDNVDEVIIDMNLTKFIDSTNLGILASIANSLYGAKGKRPIIISSNEDITIILKSMGFDQFFEIEDTNQSKSDLEFLGIDLKGPSREELNATMLHAHENLARMNKKNRAMFKDVIDLLRKDRNKN